MTNTQPAGYEVGLLLRQAHRKAALMANAALEPLGIQGRHLGVLIALSRDAPLTQRQLIDRLGSDKSAMVRTIDELEARQLCARQHSTHDRRANNVRLTDSGRNLLADAEHAAQQTAAALLAALSTSEQHQLCDLLRRVVTTE